MTSRLGTGKPHLFLKCIFDVKVRTVQGAKVSVGSATPAIFMCILLFILPQVTEYSPHITYQSQAHNVSATKKCLSPCNFPLQQHQNSIHVTSHPGNTLFYDQSVKNFMPPEEKTTQNHTKSLFLARCNLQTLSERECLFSYLGNNIFPKSSPYKAHLQSCL